MFNRNLFILCSQLVLMHIISVKSRGKTYYYARKTERVNGKPKVVWSLPLGTAEDIVKVYQKRYLTALKFQTFDFGKVAALYSIANELDFFNIIDTIIGKKDIGGLTASQYLFLIIAGRAHGPISKIETGRWFHQTFLEINWTPEHSLSCQNFLNHMDYLTVDVICQIEDELGKKLVELGIVPTTLFWDTTNFSTCIENFGDKKVPQPGNAKDKRFDKNIVGLGMAVSDENIPFFHETYPGNEHDSKVLSRMIEKMVKRLEILKVEAKDVVLIFDQGGNSPDNIESVLDKMHIVGSLKRDQVEDLIALPLEKLKFLHKSKSGAKVYVHRVKREFWEREFTVVVTYNEKTAKRKKHRWEKSKERITNGMEELVKKYSRKNGRGRKMSLKGLTQNIHDLVHKQYRGVIHWEVDQESRCLSWWIDETEEKDFTQRFGRSVIFTDMHKWTTNKIVRTYHRKNQLEDDFKWLTGKLGLSIPPYYVRLDHRIREHSFLCVLGMIFLRYLGRKLSKLRCSAQKIWNELERLRVVLAKDVKTGESQYIVEEMNSIQARAFEVLELAKFLPLN